MFPSLFLMLGKVTFDDHVNALERYWKGEISYTFYKTLTAPKLGAIKGLISCSECIFCLMEKLRRDVAEL